MATKVKTKVRFDILKEIKTMSNKRLQKSLGETILNRMRAFIAAGFSPVRGQGRYRPYAVQREDAVGDYPEGIKPAQPVNLRLDGEMLDSLAWKTTDNKNKITIGLHRDTDSEVLVRAEVHNDGTRDDIPRRAFIPDKTGEEFIVTISSATKKVYEKRLNDIIKKSNKKR